MKKKLKTEYKNLNLKGGFLSIDYKYSKELKAYKVLYVFPCILIHPIPKRVDREKYSKKVHVYEDPNSKSVNDHWIKRNDILSSIQKEGLKKSLNLENLEDPDVLYKFLGKIPRYTWLKINFKRKVSQNKYIKKFQWHMVQNFDEYCSSMRSKFKDFLFPNIKKMFTELPIDKDTVTFFCVNKWKESLYKGNSDFNMDKAKLIREWIKDWKKKSLDKNIDVEQHLYSLENTKKLEKLLDNHLKKITK